MRSFLNGMFLRACSLLRNARVFLALVMPYAIGAPAVRGEDTLQLLHVIFRHGDKTPDASATYPGDPYANETYWPYGRGQLTLKGKVDIMKMGAELRKTYDSFLGPYYEGIVDARSSGIDRAKESMELALSSLFPNKWAFWNLILPRKKISYRAVPPNQDNLLLGFRPKNVTPRLQEFFKSNDYPRRKALHSETLDIITKNTGKTYTHLEAALFHDALQTQDEWGFELPKWTSSIFPESTSKLTEEVWLTMTATTNLKRTVVGELFEKIVNDSELKINGTNNTTKIHLYSGHDFNIGSLLNTLGLYGPGSKPNYCSYLVFELHKIKNEHFVRILNQNYKQQEPIVLRLPFSDDDYCPFDKFVSSVQEYFPREDKIDHIN